MGTQRRFLFKKAAYSCFPTHIEEGIIAVTEGAEYTKMSSFFILCAIGGEHVKVPAENRIEHDGSACAGLGIDETEEHFFPFLVEIHRTRELVDDEKVFLRDA